VGGSEGTVASLMQGDTRFLIENDMKIDVQIKYLSQTCSPYQQAKHPSVADRSSQLVRCGLTTEIEDPVIVGQANRAGRCLGVAPHFQVAAPALDEQGAADADTSAKYRNSVRVLHGSNSGGWPVTRKQSV
jgi:hypothetical protein